MEPKIDAKELDEIAREASRLEREDRDKLDEAQAREVLRELDLPAEKLDEARTAAAVKRRAARERTARFKIIGAVMLVTGLVAGAVGFHAHSRREALERIVASAHTLSMDADPVADRVARSARPELKFEVVLANPPKGSPIELSCDWTGPAADVRHQNRWETKPIDKDVWPTHCRRRFETTDPEGDWSVTMKQGDRPIATERFKVE